MDIERYSARDVCGQLDAQTTLDAVLTAAAGAAGLDRAGWYRQVNGDGELSVLPADTCPAVVVGDFTRHLAAAVSDRNQGAERPLRLRIALHHGTLLPGPFGPAGDAPIVAARLLNAAPLRRLLSAQSGHDTALIISAALFRDVVTTGLCALTPERFHPARITAKGVTYHAHLHRPRSTLAAVAAA
ncbi:hypothetical protein ACGFNU_00985 [Spirillospora sp. NPDC048911]|uniref:hypothetical protein n=1 Tax=Spirillospora sp. NPDC048911 TaxID=3364527 RepID=UPI0037165E27